MKHMKRILISAIALLFASMTMTAQVTRQEVKVGNFTRLVVTDNVNVNYRCNADSAGIAVINGKQEEINHLIFSPILNNVYMRFRSRTSLSAGSMFPASPSTHHRSTRPRTRATVPCASPDCRP